MNETNFILEVKALGIDLSHQQLEQLKTYYELLVEWNQKMNLTAITALEQVYLKHFYDSLTIIKAIDLRDVDTICDVGTGAGFPGLVLKIVFPDLKVTLIDALNKRLSFLKEVVAVLKLKDVTIIHARIEEYARKNREQYDVVTARAVASLPYLIETCTPLVKINKYLILMKANINEELANSLNAINELSLKIERQIAFVLPNDNGNRTIIKFIKMAKTKEKYPRKNAEIVKKTL